MIPARRRPAPWWVLPAALLLAGPTSGQVPLDAVTPPTARIAYGVDSLQFGDLRIPEGSGPFPVVVTIHGGCWIDALGEGTLAPAASVLPGEGIATWDVEYRRLGHEGGGWPGSFQDVGAAVDHLRELAREYPLDLDRIVLAGHSSGAPLAVWAAGRPDLPPVGIRGEDPLPVRAAVAIDGPVDLAAWAEAGTDVSICGRPVIQEFMGGTPSEIPERYALASPVEMPPFEAAIYLNPAAMILSVGDSDGMPERARETGESVAVRPVPDSDHFQLIVPGTPSWDVVLATLREAVGAGGAGTPGGTAQPRDTLRVLAYDVRRGALPHGAAPQVRRHPPPPDRAGAGGPGLGPGLAPRGERHPQSLPRAGPRLPAGTRPGRAGAGAAPDPASR